MDCQNTRDYPCAIILYIIYCDLPRFCHSVLHLVPKERLLKTRCLKLSTKDFLSLRVLKELTTAINCLFLLFVFEKDILLQFFLRPGA